MSTPVSPFKTPDLTARATRFAVRAPACVVEPIADRRPSQLINQESHRGMLTFVSAGLVLVDVANVRHFVGRQHAVWIPASTVYAIRMQGPWSGWELKITPNAGAQFPTYPIAFEWDSILETLLRRASAHAASAADSAALLLRQMMKCTCFLSPAKCSLPWPYSAPLLDVANALDQGDRLTLDDISYQFGIKKNAIKRGFRVETGITLSEWRRRLLIFRALNALYGGNPHSRDFRIGYQAPTQRSDRFDR